MSGFEVVLLDSSEPKLDLARREADARRTYGSISFRLGDAAHLSDLFDPSSFHVVVCHNLLEFMEDPPAVLRGLAELLEQDPKSVVSLLVRNRWGEVLRAAVREQDTAEAKAVLAADTVQDSLYGSRSEFSTLPSPSPLSNRRDSSLWRCGECGLRQTIENVRSRTRKPTAGWSSSNCCSAHSRSSPPWHAIRKSLLDRGSADGTWTPAGAQLGKAGSPGRFCARPGSH